MGGKGRGHGEHGKVTAVSESRDKKHVRVTVRHGRDKKPTKKEPFPDSYDRETTMRVPAHKAKHFPVGKKVRMAMHPVDDNDGDEAGDLYGGKGY